MARYAATHGKAFVEESTAVPHETQKVVIVWVYRYDVIRVLYIGFGDEGCRTQSVDDGDTMIEVFIMDGGETLVDVMVD